MFEKGGITILNLILAIKWEYIFSPKLALESLPFVLSGLSYTLLISLLSFLISLFGGTILALMRISPSIVLQKIAKFYISFFRGVPILVTLFFLYFGLPLANVTLNAIQASIIGFSLTSSAYSSEIIRSAIVSLDRGQWEAAQSLGLPYNKILNKVIFPQAFKIAIPPLSNILLDLVKSSSLTAMITVPDIFQKAKIVGGANNDYMTMYFLVAIIYWFICVIYGKLQDYLELQYDLDQKQKMNDRVFHN